MIPVVGFATLKRFDLADRLVKSIDYPVEHLVIVDNSGTGTYLPPENENVLHTWVLPMPYGLGLVGAWNLVIKATPYAPFWLLVNDDAWFEQGALQTIARGVKTNTINFVNIAPKWSCVVFGEGMISRVGLYDENFYPLYFDDDDLERRVSEAGLVPNFIEARVGHDNSSTLASGFQEVNSRTYAANAKRFNQKVLDNDFSGGNWSLDVRRANRWD